MSLTFNLYVDVDTGGPELHRIVLLNENITHNLMKMANEAGVYEALWEPIENGFASAGDIIEVLESGIRRMIINQEYYEQFNPPNGWGTYGNLLESMCEIVQACREHPKALIYTHR